MKSADRSLNRPLGKLEQQVMEALWDNGPATIRQIINILGGTLAYTTIATVLSNLERKDLVTSEREGRSVRYIPRCSRDIYAAQLMEQALSTSDNRAASILHFLTTIEPDDAQLLRGYLLNNGADQ